MAAYDATQFTASFARTVTKERVWGMFPSIACKGEGGNDTDPHRFNSMAGS